MPIYPIIDVEPTAEPAAEPADASSGVVSSVPPDPPPEAPASAISGSASIGEPAEQAADPLIEILRRGIAADADPAARAAGWDACQRVAALLMAPASTPPAPASAPGVAPALRAAMEVAVELIRSVPPTQRLDTALTYLRGALPAGLVATSPLRLQFVPLPGR
jgi:hypothetical protein